MTLPDSNALSAGRAWLEALGFNLCAVLDVDTFTGELRDAFKAARVIPGPGERLVVLGMAGSAMWTHLEERSSGTDHPFDDFSREAALSVSQRFWGDRSPRILYPGVLPIPLQQLGRVAGWACPSPLGLDISPLYGPWFAYRAVFFVKTPLPFTSVETAESPCRSCRAKPCLTACPAGAVHSEGAFQLDACLTQRLDDPSGCGVRCKSRLACPVGAQHRYSDAQLDYHGQNSFDALRRWSAAKPQ